MERIGKIEKWILTTCYRKTVLKEVPENWIMDTNKYTKPPEDFYFTYLFRTDILLNFYDLDRSNKTTNWKGDGCIKFKTTPKYKQALMTITRIEKQLFNKGLIDSWKGENRPVWRGIILTDTGKEKAIKLLNDNT